LRSARQRQPLPESVVAEMEVNICIAASGRPRFWHMRHSPQSPGWAISMWFSFRKVPLEKVGSAAFSVTYRMQTGAGRREAATMGEVEALLAELRSAAASDVTVIDAAGHLVSFDPEPDGKGS